MESDFLALRIRAANRDIPLNENGSLPEEWLLVEWPKDQAEPTDYWLSTLPDTTPIAELVRYAKMRWRIEHDYRELKTGLGLAHFEGRTWLGWNHHATLVSAAHVFLATLRLTQPKASGAARVSTASSKNSNEFSPSTSDTAPTANNKPPPNQVLHGQ